MAKRARQQAAASQEEDEEKVVFVTVGTTRFDALVQTITSPAALDVLGAQDFTRLVVQVGASPAPSSSSSSSPPPATADELGAPSQTPGRRRRSSSGSGSGSGRQSPRRAAAAAAAARPVVEWYRYKDSLRPDLERAALVVSHAGAGSIMEALDLGKPLVVAVNTALMDDHQQELAHAMEEQGFLVATDPPHLVAALRSRSYEGLKPRPPPTQGLLPALLDEEMGFVAAAGGGASGPAATAARRSSSGSGSGSRRKKE